MHHCHYGLGLLRVHMEQVHTDFNHVTIMQNMISKLLYAIWEGSTYVCFVTLTITLIRLSLLQLTNNQTHN